MGRQVCPSNVEASLCFKFYNGEDGDNDDDNDDNDDDYNDDEDDVHYEDEWRWRRW